MSFLDLFENSTDTTSSFCSTECKAFCCRKGFLILKTESEINIVTNGKRTELEGKGILKKLDNGCYSLELKFGCPSLSKDNQCLIHDSPGRPNVCKDFPLLFCGKNIITSPSCPLIVQNKLYSFFERQKKEGYKII